MRTLVSPFLPRDTAFRPIAALYYYLGARLFDLHYAPYIFAIHILHLINVALVWLLARSLRASLTGAFAAALLFAFHAGTFSVYWAPMFVFDLLCATFILLTLLTYARGHLFLSLLCFWLALKSKEIAIMLPVVLAAYEIFLGDRKWKRLLPFFAISSVLGIQALLLNTHRDNDYSFHFSPATLWTCAKFYASQLVSAPETIAILVSLTILAIALALPNKLTRFGVIAFLAMLLPMLALPGRLFGAYLYVPLIGLAIAISAISRPVWLAIFVLWIPWNYRQFRIERTAEIAAANDRRAWAEPVIAFARAHPDALQFVFDGQPGAIELFGMLGAINSAHPPNTEAALIPFDDDRRMVAFQDPKTPLLVWDPVFHKEQVLARQPDVPYIQMSRFSPQWQLLDGWIDEGYNYRWIAPNASARLAEPSAARTFEVTVYPPASEIQQLHQLHLTIKLDHIPIGSAIIDHAAPSTLRFALLHPRAGPVEVEFLVSPALPDPAGSSKLYGLPVGAFGFVE